MDGLEQIAGALGGDMGVDATGLPPVAPAAPVEPVKSPYADYKTVNEHIDKALEVDKQTRPAFERSWFRNVLFDVGQHWIIYDNREKRWRAKELPSFFPRAKTNKFAKLKGDVMSVLTSSEPPINYFPATDNPDDRATVEVAEQMRDVIYEESGLDDKSEELAAWVVLTGNGFLLPYYDPEGNGTSFVAHQQCADCGGVYTPGQVQDADGACPDCGGVQLADAQDPETQEPLGDSFDVGQLGVDVCSPFEIRLDYRERDWSKHKKFVRIRRWSLEYAKEKYPDMKDKLTGTDKEVGDTRYFLDVLASVTDVQNNNTEASKGKVTVYELFELPSEDFPDGLHAVRVGQGEEQVMEAGPLETEYGAGPKKGEKFLPLVPFGWEVVPGRFWRKTRMDDVVPLQVFRNTVEANMQLTAQRMGNPMWLNPKGSGLEMFSGEPGWVADYNPVSFGGTSFAKPERLPAELSNLQSLVMLINQIDDSMERVAGTFFLQGGDTPPGVTAASALAYLGERAQKSMSPLMRSWAKGFKHFEELALEIARANWTEDRIRTIAGRNRQWESQTFKGADLTGAVNMRIDYENMFPKSQATRRATVAQLAQLGMLNPLNPQQNYKVLELFGETGLQGDTDVDIREATKESEQFLSTTEYVPEVIPMVQNSQIHLMQHTTFAKTDEFKELDPERQQAWYQHIQQHVVDMMQAQQTFGAPQPQGGAPQLNGAEGPDPRGQGDAKGPGNAEDNTPQQGSVPDMAMKGGPPAPPQG